MLFFVVLTYLSLTWSTNGMSTFMLDNIPILKEQINSKTTEEILSLINVFKAEFTNFQKTYNKIYKSEEENRRFVNYISSFVEIESHNDLYNKGQMKYEMGINHMSDWVIYYDNFINNSFFILLEH